MREDTDMKELHREPPIPSEQWLSYVLALQSHRSSNPAQREFGTRIMELVFTQIPARFEMDPTSRAYFDSVLAEVAWAVRGLSVVRDIYQTNIGAIEKAHNTELQRIESLRKLSPFASDSLWGKTKGSLVGIGLAAPLFALTTRWFGTAAPVWLISGAVVVALGLTGMEVFLGWYIARQLSKLHTSVPGATLDTWRDKALTGYKAVATGFLSKLTLIEKRYFPESTEKTLQPKDIEEVLQRAFSVDAAFPRTGNDSAGEHSGQRQE